MSQLYLEKLEEIIVKNISRHKIKFHTKELIKLLEPIAEKHYNKIFEIDENVVQTIQFEYEKLISLIAAMGIQKTVSLSQTIEAIELDPVKMQNAAIEILKQHEDTK